MFAGYYFADQGQRARVSPHKQRIDHVAEALQYGPMPVPDAIDRCGSFLADPAGSSATKAGVTMGTYVRYDYGREALAALEMWAERLQAIIVPDRVATVTRLPARS